MSPRPNRHLLLSAAMLVALFAAACQPAPPPPKPPTAVAKPAPTTTAKPAPAPAPSTRNPIGRVDAVAVSGTAVKLTGWALDPDSTAPVTIRITVDGRQIADVAANGSRPDVDAAHKMGPNRGFDHSVTTAVGDRQVCLQALNVGAGTAHLNLGCRSAATGATVPGGFADSNRFPAAGYTVRIHPNAAMMATDIAWAASQIAARSGVPLNVGAPATSVDPDLARSEIVIHVGNMCGGTAVGCARSWWEQDTRLTVGSSVSVAAGYTRHALTRALLMHELAHSLGLAHFTDNFAGKRQIMHTNLSYEVTALQTGDINGLGEVGAVGRRRAEARSPIGALEAVAATPAGVSVAGWAADPDQGGGATNVVVTVDGVAVAGPSAANLVRHDIAAAHPDLGAHHGFRFNVPAAPGTRQVCVTGGNVKHGSDTRLGCRTVSVGAAGRSMAAAAATAEEPPAPAADPLPLPALEVETEPLYLDPLSSWFGPR